MTNKNCLSEEQSKKLIWILKERFERNMSRHKDIYWIKLKEKLESSPERLWSINEMEKTGWDPDVIDYDKNTDEYTFCDCSIESPKGRRSLCYDNEALESRKEHKPKNSSINMAKEMWVEILTEEQYINLQKLWNFDNKTSSWLKTPLEIRKLGGAIFADFRYNNVFIYHNGAESYYAVRWFRTSIKV